MRERLYWNTPCDIAAGGHAIFQLEKLFEFIKRMVYNEGRFIVCCKMEKIMNTSDMIKELCNKKNVSVSELVRRTVQTTYNFDKKQKWNPVYYSLNGIREL